MKRNLLQVLLALALFGVVIQVVLVAPHAVKDHELENQTAAAPPQNSDTVDQSLQGMHMIETQQGGKEWELWSDKADRLKQKDLLKLQQVKTIFFAKSGNTFTVTGERGTVEVATKNLRVEGNVITRSSNGYTFKSASLDYDSAKKTLFTTSAVEMLGPPEQKSDGLKLTGHGMQAQTEKGTMEILNDVHADKTFADGKKIFIRSRRALFSGNDRSAQFLDGVVLDMQTMRITGPEAQFEYDPKTDSIRTLTVKGGAKVSDVDKWATSDNLKVDFDNDKFTFWGHPRVVQDNDELKGEEIVFLDNGRQVQVHKARAKMDNKKMGKVD